MKAEIAQNLLNVTSMLADEELRVPELHGHLLNHQNVSNASSRELVVTGEHVHRLRHVVALIGGVQCDRFRVHVNLRNEHHWLRLKHRRRGGHFEITE